MKTIEFVPNNIMIFGELSYLFTWKTYHEFSCNTDTSTPQPWAVSNINTAS